MNDEWETPLDLYDKLNKEFNFEFDLCTNLLNSRCESSTDNIELFISELEYDSGFKNYWMNPPYSRGNIDICMEQAYKLFKRGRLVVCLVEFDPSTKWYQKWVHDKASEVRMLNKRVKFQGTESAYNFPCCIVIYNPELYPEMNLIALGTEYNIWGY